jgi:hypothetical protein
VPCIGTDIASFLSSLSSKKLYLHSTIVLVRQNEGLVCMQNTISQHISSLRKRGDLKVLKSSQSMGLRRAHLTDHTDTRQVRSTVQVRVRSSVLSS